jgi:pilus assembly protein CpaF
VYFLNKAVDSNQNVVISGGGGTGKTTLLSVLSSFIDGNQRVITVEDATEVTVQVKNYVRMELPKQGSGNDQITMKDLLKNALRMRPNRIIVGECRGEEMADMLLAMNTGHEGSMTTIHANKAVDALSRIESMVLHSGTKMPPALIQQNIASTIHLIVHLERDANGQRRLDEIIEIQGWDNGRYLTAPIFVWDSEQGLISTGTVPRFAVSPPVAGVSFGDAQKFFHPATEVKLDRK